MEHDLDHPLVYHGSSDAPSLVTELLCRILRRTLDSYNDLAIDIARGKLDDEYDTWVDFDDYDSYRIVEITERNAEQRHLGGFRGLMLSYDDHCVVAVADLDAGRDLIALACGREILLIDEHDPTERCWAPHTFGGPDDPPTEPSPRTCPPRRHARR